MIGAARRALSRLSLPRRLALVGAVLLGAGGAVTGAVIGLRTYAPTAWAAALEVGLPAALLGAAIGFAAGSLVVGVRRARRGRAGGDERSTDRSTT